MGLIAQDGIAYVVIVGGLHAVKEDDVFQFHGVAHHAPGAHQGAAPDEGAVAHLRLRADDAGAAQVGSGGHGGGFMHPDLGGNLVVPLQSGAYGEDEVLYAYQGLPGIGELGKIVLGDGVIQVKQVFYSQHNGLLTS